MTSLISLSGTISVFATEENDITCTDDTSLESYIEHVLQNYLYGYETGIQIGYSNPIPYIDFSTGNCISDCFFVFGGDTIIGRLFVNNSEGKFSSTFYGQDNTELQSAFDNNLEIAIGCYNNNVISFTEENGYSLVDGVFEELYPSSFPQRTEIIFKEKSISVPINTLALNSESRKILSVPVVANDPSLGTGAGICWASCVAMKMNYQKGLHLEASDVYYATANKMHDMGIDSDPLGIPSNIKWAYEAYSYSVTYKNSAVTPNEIFGMLSLNKPVQISISGTDSSGETVGHAVIIYGIAISDSSSSNTDITLYIKDPNTNLYQLVNFSGNPNIVKSNISYSPYYTTTVYERWFDTYE